MAFIGFKVDPSSVIDLWERYEFPGEKKNIGRAHITSLFLGHDLKVEVIEKAVEAAKTVAKRSRPFTCTIDRIHGFEPSDMSRGTVPIVARARGDELHRIHQMMRKAYDDAGIEYNKEFDKYHPHITLSKSEKLTDANISFPVFVNPLYLKKLVFWDDNAVFAELPLYDDERKVLFLDVDGVLNYEEHYDGMQRECIEQLIRVLRMTECDIVVSSTWRISGLGPGSTFYDKLMEVAGESYGRWIMARIIGQTPAKMSLYHRGTEISMWLEENEYRGRFAIVDDEEDVRPFNDVLVKTDSKKGLTAEDASKLIHLLTF